MTKEQEAIKRLKSIDETVEECDGNILKADIETVFNMIKEKDKQIAKKDKRLNRQSKLLNKKDKEIGKKDKQIDLMVDSFQQICITPSLAKYWWKRICKGGSKICEGRLCEECIKQYFERKARDE